MWAKGKTLVQTLSCKWPISTCCGKEEEAPIQEADVDLKIRLVFWRLLAIVGQSHNHISDSVSKDKTHICPSQESVDCGTIF